MEAAATDACSEEKRKKEISWWLADETQNEKETDKRLVLWGGLTGVALTVPLYLGPIVRSAVHLIPRQSQMYITAAPGLP